MGSAGGASLALAALLLIASGASTASAAKYTVGDTSGWTTGADYTTWASGKKLKVGDSLVFNYAGGAHNVAEVSAADYASCSAANALSNDGGSGTSTVALKTAGKHYFICGVTGHCSNGMKLVVNVAAAATAASPPPKASPTPDSPDTTPDTTPESPSTSTGGATPKTPVTVLAPPAKQTESGATGLRATALAGLGLAGLVASVLF